MRHALRLKAITSIDVLTTCWPTVSQRALFSSDTPSAGTGGSLMNEGHIAARAALALSNAAA